MAADTDPGWRAYLPPAVQALPADLAAVVALVVLTVLSAVLPGVRETPIRVVLGLPFVLFVPGYAFIAALFPEAGTHGSDADAPSAEESAAPSRDRGIDGIERVALSFGTSIAIVPLIGLALNFTPWGIRLVPILVSVSGFTLVAAFVGTRRRAALDPDDRFAVPYREWIARARRELFEPDTRTDLALNVLLAVSILLAVGSVGYAVAVPQQGESFTEFYLLTEGEDGDLVADGYPTDFVAGEPESLVVGVTNQEHEEVSYTVVTEVQRVETANNSTTVLESESGPRFSPTLAHNETWTRQHRVAPTLTGERLRLTYLLYRGDPPATPTTENAYRELHLWVNVTAT
ncbi:DUF1616 domain-containing protein [Halobellus ruber]|uniref:DUF1616 domain-containing protein n=1 Tax=Halobellus ruber TaxID=2761102 RepID=A0A7J9SJ90_9EURY|nr:DUF1616 domain-containing protein [Halobellus ruber]MBB6646602.1 DUF1616 domain-containing protein [Halobellus ruber]